MKLAGSAETGGTDRSVAAAVARALATSRDIYGEWGQDTFNACRVHSVIVLRL